MYIPFWERENPALRGFFCPTLVFTTKKVPKPKLWDFKQCLHQSLFDFPVQSVTTKEFIVLHQLQLGGSSLLVLIRRVAAHAWNAAAFLFGTLDRYDHASAFCFLSHIFLSRANHCAVM